MSVTYSPDTFYGYISKIDPSDAEIRKVENAGFFRLAIMIPEIDNHVENERDLDNTAIAILGFEVSGDFEIMASMKSDLIQFMESYQLKKYFNPKPTIFAGFYWDLEPDDEEDDTEEEEETEEEEDTEEELDTSDEEDTTTEEED